MLSDVAGTIWCFRFFNIIHLLPWNVPYADKNQLATSAPVALFSWATAMLRLSVPHYSCCRLFSSFSLLQFATHSGRQIASTLLSSRPAEILWPDTLFELFPPCSAAMYQVATLYQFLPSCWITVCASPCMNIPGYHCFYLNSSLVNL